MRLALLAALLLAGCGDGERAKNAETPEKLDFAGRWAASVDMCASGWWEFGAAEVRTAGELTCRVTREERTASTATLQLSCMGEGTRSNERWKLRALDGGQLSVSRDAAAPITLTRCGE